MMIRLLAGVLASCSAFCVTLPAAPIQVPPGQRQLFLDDYCVARIEGLQKTMHQPEKKGAVVVPDRPWEVWIQTRCAPAWDEKERVFKIWLLTCPPDPTFAGTTYAESKDGIHWTKPSLGQKEYKGSKENNFVTVDPKLPWGANCIESVVYDPADPDESRRYKGLMGAEYRQPIASPDGIHWRLLDAPKLTSGDEGNLYYDLPRHTFIATLKTFTSFGRAHAIWTSKDFVAWTRLSAVFQADAEDQRLGKAAILTRLADRNLQPLTCNDPADYRVDIYNLGLFRYEGLYIGLPAVYHATGKVGNNTDGFHLIQLACSRNLESWQRLGDRRAFIGPSPIGQGAYDLTELLPPSAPVAHGDELWFYYTGIKYREPPANADPKQGAVCLAVLRRDGFISLDAGNEPGTLVTKPFVAEAAKLCVNVDASAGSLDVEVLGANEKPAAGSKTIVGDQLRAQVPWKSGDLASLQGQTVRLRFTLRGAKLYSFWLEP